MKHIFLCISFCCLINSVVYSVESKSDSIPPFVIGNKWLFNVNENNNGTTINYLMTKEIVDTINSNKFIINTKKYIENSVIDSVEYWTWQDSSFSISEYINSNGPVIYKFGQQNYYLSNGVHIYIYTNIIDTILSIISEGAI